MPKYPGSDEVTTSSTIGSTLSTSTSATTMASSPAESYKKQNGLDYPVNVARWGKRFHFRSGLFSTMTKMQCYEFLTRPVWQKISTR